MASAEGDAEGISQRNLQQAKSIAQLLKQAETSDDVGLFICTGAGMSVVSGVPVFRGSDGTMSPEFLRFLKGYNDARQKANLYEVDDWFGFSVPEMFDKPTESAAWDYWKWRITRSDVECGSDYGLLMNIVNKFGIDKAFVQTSNVDHLHQKAGMPEDQMYEIHGSLGYVQCAKPCYNYINPVEQIEHTLYTDEVPRCPNCSSCQRPNVVIFGDDRIVHSRISNQRGKFREFGRRYSNKRIIIEIGAGTVVASIRNSSYRLANFQDNGNSLLVRINPGESECEDTSWFKPNRTNRLYKPIQDYAGNALQMIWNEYSKL